MGELSLNARELESISFGIMSTEDIINSATCEINVASMSTDKGCINDLRLGTVHPRVNCETCKGGILKCPGHFGYIKLNIPIIIFQKEACMFAKCFCFHCKRILCSLDEIKLAGIKTYEKSISHVSKQDLCFHCKTFHPSVKIVGDVIVATWKKLNTTKELTPYFLKSIFDLIPEEDVKLLFINPARFHPRNLILTAFPVSPPACRPKMYTPENVSEDDLTNLLFDIVKNNNILAHFNPEDKEYKKAALSIHLKTLAYCDNTKGKVTHNTKRKPVKGIKEILSRKNGLIRKHMMGKRCNHTGRTVIGPDPTLSIKQVAIPRMMAEGLTIKEHVTKYNKDRMNNLLKNKQITTVIRSDGSKINVLSATSTDVILCHGDVIKGTHGDRIVYNCKEIVGPNEKVFRKKEEVKPKEKKEFSLIEGDVIERLLQNNDTILVNRQPTLHKNSMQALKVVIKEGMTIRINLALTYSFNADFDGDEMNIFIGDSLEARAELEELSMSHKMILSNQMNKPMITIVQDALLGAYLMTTKNYLIPKAKYMDILMKINVSANIKEYTTFDLLSHLFPLDFFYEYENVIIKAGKFLHGPLTKAHLGPTKNSLIRILCMEYGNDISSKFIDEIQFITNAWLETRGFSIGLDDCFIDNKTEKSIQDMIQTCFQEANSFETTIESSIVREEKIQASLNKAENVGKRMAKDLLSPDNNFLSTVISGSKGVYYNITQITGTVGQQNVMGKRIFPSCNDGKRTLIHYPFKCDTIQDKYESRGFVSSSFVKGLNPRELLFHAMSGREGIIKTAMMTATSGYGQHRIVKVNEDLKIFYDGTVRDSMKNIYQWKFGKFGFDPSKTTIKKNGEEPCDIDRMLQKYQHQSNEVSKPIAEKTINEIAILAVRDRPIPGPINTFITFHQRNYIKNKLKNTFIGDDVFPKFRNELIAKYNTAIIDPGECVGIIGAQSIGENQTQSTLNTFHKAGKSQSSGMDRFQELLNVTKKLKYKTCICFLKKKYNNPEEIRIAINYSIVYLDLEKLVDAQGSIITDDANYFYIRYILDLKTMYKYKINPIVIAEKIHKTFSECVAEAESFSIIVRIEKTGYPDEMDYISTIKPKIEKTQICGIKGIENMHIDYDKQINEWFIQTDGSNLAKLLIHPLIDPKRIYCNNIWEVYECFGLVKAKQVFFEELVQNTNGVLHCHLKLLTDKMFYLGIPMPISRYSMRTSDIGPLSKCTFEESNDILIAAGFKTEVDTLKGVSSSIICGNKSKIGTGFMDIYPDVNAMGLGSYFYKKEPEIQKLLHYENNYGLEYESDYDQDDSNSEAESIHDKEESEISELESNDEEDEEEEEEEEEEAHEII